MHGFSDLKKILIRVPTDVVGIDCSADGLRVIRMRKTGNDLSVVGSTILESVGIDAGEVKSVDLPAKVCAKYAALTIPARPEAIKLLRVPESFDPENVREILAKMNFKEEDRVRLVVRVLMPGTPKIDACLLAAIMPEEQASGLLGLMPASGAPAARSLELAELAVINAFCCDPRFKDGQQARGLIHFDHQYSLIALFNGNKLSQVRTFSFGVQTLLLKVCKVLNVDQQTALAVLTDGAIDVSHLVEENMRFMRSQLVLCRDFMERSENCVLEDLYISGPASLTRLVMHDFPAQDKIKNWDALEPYLKIDDHAVTEDLANESWSMAAAVGACLGLLPS